MPVVPLSPTAPAVLSSIITTLVDRSSLHGAENIQLRSIISLDEFINMNCKYLNLKNL